MNEVFLQPLTQALEGDLKEYQYQKKKLESRRLDFDAKNAKLKSSKGPTDALEAEVNAARSKFEETLQLSRDLMIKINSENEVLTHSICLHLHQELTHFYDYYSFLGKKG